MKGATYEGVGFEGKICGVSILRAGEASEMLPSMHTHNAHRQMVLGNGGRPSRSLSECPNRQDLDPASTFKRLMLPNTCYNDYLGRGDCSSKAILC